MNKKAGILATLILCCSLFAHAYSNKKAILQLTRESQPDSLGYNFVGDLANDAYGWISNGQVVLWDSPEKKKVLNFADLLEIEKSSQSLFTQLSNVFIYEKWTSDKRDFSFTVKGFSFTSMNVKGQEVLFGFIECNPSTKELLQATPAHVNANGIYGVTMYSALMNMGFQFTLIYFNKGPLVDHKSINRIVKDALNSRKNNLSAIPVKISKLVEYGWDTTDMKQASLLKDLLVEFYIFFNDNKQEFFNDGGDKYYSYLRDAPILISDFHVIETWTKDQNGKLTITPQSIVIYTGGIRLQPIPFEKPDVWKLNFKGIPLSQFLVNKDFPYQLKKINETMIPPGASESSKNALFAGNWYHIY